MSDSIYKKGNIGIMSRSATLSYEIVNNLSNKGIGQSTVVGVGGDFILGSSFINPKGRIPRASPWYSALRVNKIMLYLIV